MKSKQNISIQTLLEMPNGRAKSKELGMEEMFEGEIQKLRKKLPNVSFWEMRILGQDGLATQSPTSLEEMRVQAMWLKFGKAGETKEMYAEKYRNGDFDFYYKKHDEKK